MAEGVDAVFQAALALPAEDRAVLAEKLLESLEGKERAEVDAAWAVEAERRINAYERGLMKAVPAEEVFRFLDGQP
jgi:putative addiction module component (TIGR02574 family)